MYFKHLVAVLLSLVLFSSFASAAITRNLSVGMRGDDVKQLQQILIAGGYLPAGTIPTNYFGQATRAAVVKFQKDKKLPATGFVGALTRAALLQNPTTTITQKSTTQSLPALGSSPTLTLPVTTGASTSTTTTAQPPKSPDLMIFQLPNGSIVQIDMATGQIVKTIVAAQTTTTPTTSSQSQTNVAPTTTPPNITTSPQSQSTTPSATTLKIEITPPVGPLNPSRNAMFLIHLENTDGSPLKAQPYTITLDPEYGVPEQSPTYYFTTKAPSDEGLTLSPEPTQVPFVPPAGHYTNVADHMILHSLQPGNYTYKVKAGSVEKQVKFTVVATQLHPSIPTASVIALHIDPLYAAGDVLIAQYAIRTAGDFKKVTGIKLIPEGGKQLITGNASLSFFLGTTRVGDGTSDNNGRISTSLAVPFPLNFERSDGAIRTPQATFINTAPGDYICTMEFTIIDTNTDQVSTVTTPSFTITVPKMIFPSS